MTKAQKFIELFRYWSGKLDLPFDIKIQKDNRYECRVACITSDDGSKLSYLIYNSYKIARWSEAALVCGMFHEIGHILNKLPYDTKEEMYKSEYEAEKFALKMLEKHYPVLAKKNIKETKAKLKKPYFTRLLLKHHVPLLKALRVLYSS